MIENNVSFPFWVDDVTDDQFGLVSGPFELGAGEIKTLTNTAVLTGTTTNTVTATARNDQCTDSDTASVVFG